MLSTMMEHLGAMGEFLGSHRAGICAGVSLFYGLAALYRCKSRLHHEWRSNNIPVEDVKKLTFVPEKKQFYFGLSGDQKPKAKMTYNKQDFGDYVAMTCLSWLSSGLAFGFSHVFSRFVGAASIFLVATFALRHGAELNRAPLLLSQPFHCILKLFAYKWSNMRLGYFAMISLCLAEVALFSSGILQKLPVYSFLETNVVSKIGDKYMTNTFWWLTFGAFHLHLAVLTTFRFLTFLAHVWSHKHVFSFLSETGWKKVLSFVPRVSKQPTSILYHLEEMADHFVGLLHAFTTGLYTHLITVIPWYCYLRLVDSSARSAGPEAPLDATLCFMLMLTWIVRAPLIEQKIVQDFEDNELNDWYIRDHWLGHHDLFEFNYMHGPHHDALPVGMIAVADNGPVEGLVRHFLGHFDSFKCPPHSFYSWTKTVVRDLVGHQYVPGVFPWSFSVVDVGVHHIEHHFLSMHPLGNGIESDPDPRNNCEVETWLSGDRYSANNKVWNWFVQEVAKFEVGLVGKEKAEKMVAKLKLEANASPPDGSESKKD